MGRENLHVRQQKRDNRNEKKQIKQARAAGKEQRANERSKALQEEDDLDKILAEFNKAEKASTKLTNLPEGFRPSPRGLFSFVAHPSKDELCLFGGEFYNGKIAEMYSDFYTYSIPKKEWKQYVVEDDNQGPPPRSGHSTVVRTNNGGEMWVFGGQFSSKTASQYVHYSDLWVFRFQEKKWEKILSNNGPSARSGHRMVLYGSKLFVFGGFYDNCKGSPRFFNDTFFFDLDSYEWLEIKVKNTILAPTPRSAVQLAVHDDKVLLVGGFSRVKGKGDSEKGVVHNDSYTFGKTETDQSEFIWTRVRPDMPNPLAGVAVCQRSGTPYAYSFGGVADEQVDDVINGSFNNDLWSINLENYTWKFGNLKMGMDRKELQEDQEHNQRLKIKVEKRKRREEKRKQKLEAKKNMNNTKNKNTKLPPKKKGPPAKASSSKPTAEEEEEALLKQMKELSMDVNKESLWPRPRMSTGLTVKGKMLYLYGGLHEIGDKEVYCTDLYALDLTKNEKWLLLQESNKKSDWQDDSESETSEDEDE